MRGVELDRELRAGEAEAVVDRAENAGGVAERERILEVARGARAPTGTSRPAARASARCAARCPDTAARRRRPGAAARCWPRRPPSRAPRATVQASSRRSGVGQRERREPGAEGVVVDQRDALLGGQGHVAADAVGEVGQRAEIALARGAEHPHARRLAGVERVDDARRAARGARPRCPSRTRSRAAPWRRARPRAGRPGPVGHAVIAQQAPVVGVHLVGADAHALAHADAGRDAVDAVGALDRALDHGARGLHASERVGARPRRARRRGRRARPLRA